MAFQTLRLLLLVLGPAAVLTDPIVDTVNGRVMGKVSHVEGKQVEEYLGIPFAAPPVGELRWRKPVPAEPWTGVLNATQYSPHCTHLLAFGYPVIGLSGENGEDCLYINIWVPDGVSAIEGRKLPVMFFIYGGGFSIGTGEMYPGPALAVHGDVIVVNFNYRLNVFGFLSTLDDACSGNFGLWDQHAALQWVQANIDAFNGDPSKVTIFGHSAGGASVSHLVLSPYTNTLFQNAIAISGGSTASWSMSRNPVNTAKNLGEEFGCPTNDTQEMIDCLREVGTFQLAAGPGSYNPVVDGDFVSRHPLESFQMGEGKHINFATGSAFHDSQFIVLGDVLGLPGFGRETVDNATVYRGLLARLSWALNADELLDEVIRVYPDLNTEDDILRTITYTRAQTDESFGAPANLEANWHSRAGGPGRTYQYLFKYRQSFLIGYPDWVEGSHLDDIYCSLGTPFFEYYLENILRQNWSDTDTAVSRQMMAYYANFAYTGNPNEGPFPVDPEWPEFTDDNERFLLESAKYESRDFYEYNIVDIYRLWNEELPRMGVPRPPPSDHLVDRPPVKLTVDEGIQQAFSKVKQEMRQFLPCKELWAPMEAVLYKYLSAHKDLFKK